MRFCRTHRRQKSSCWPFSEKTLDGSSHPFSGLLMHLAEFNIGLLKYDWDDPRVADFADNLDRVYNLARRAPGYVWHLDGAEMEAAQLDPDGPLLGNARVASTLSVWQSPEALRAFAFQTVHRQFYDRREEWYDEAQQLWQHRLVMWWVPEGHCPDLTEAVARLHLLEQNGHTDAAFGWHYLAKDADVPT